MAQAATTSSARRNGHEPDASADARAPRPSPIAVAARPGRGASSRHRPAPDPARRPRRARPRLHPRAAAAVLAVLEHLVPRRGARAGQHPRDGPVLLVGNHSGGNMTPDTMVFTLAFSTYFGVERAFYQLAHNLVLSMPGLGWLRKFGTVAASPDNARKALSRAPRCSSTRAATTRSTARAGRATRRLRRTQGLHPARARSGRSDRPGGRDRRPGDRAVHHPRRAPRAPARARPHPPPEGPAGLAVASLDPQHRRLSATSPCRPRSRSRRCRRST